MRAGVRLWPIVDRTQAPAVYATLQEPRTGRACPVDLAVSRGAIPALDVVQSPGALRAGDAFLAVPRKEVLTATDAAPAGRQTAGCSWPEQAAWRVWTPTHQRYS